MTSILKQENGELFIYRQDWDFPTRHPRQVIGNHEDRLISWFSSSERIKVAEGEEKHFNIFVYGRSGPDMVPAGELKQSLEAGIPIPESCYEVREKAGVYGMTKKGNQYFPGEKLAYFKDDRASEKETGEYEKTMQWAEKQLNRPHEHTSLDPKEQMIAFANAYHKRALEVGANCKGADWFLDDFLENGKLV